jgi:hypothetical protein
MIVGSLLLLCSAGAVTVAATAQTVAAQVLSPAQASSVSGSGPGQLSLGRATNQAIADLLKNVGPADPKILVSNSLANLQPNPGKCAEPLLLAKVPQDVDSSMPKLKTDGRLDPMTVKPMPVCRH